MKPYLPNLDALVGAGIDPKTGLPYKLFSASSKGLKENMRKQLRILDEQNAVNRYEWKNLPSGLTGQLLERILYYRGQGAFFYMKSNGKFYFLPYALSGQLDVYGRFLGITPLPFMGQSQTNEEGKVQPWITGLRKIPQYDVPSELTPEIFEDGCVLLSDYTKQLSQINIPRKDIQEPLLEVMSEVIPMARTSMIANCGVKGVRVNNEDQASEVKLQSMTVAKNALEGNPWVPVQGATEFQDFGNGQVLKSEEYLLFLQALDNYRLSLYGLQTGGLFQKKSHMLEAENEQNSQQSRLAYQDGLTLRRRFCDIVNSIWQIGIWCDESKCVRNNLMETVNSNRNISATFNEESEDNSENE